MSFNPPHRRHYIQRVSQTERGVKNRNTVIEPRVNIVDDVAAINAGKAEQNGETFLINGRTYGLHGSTLFPIAGPGFYLLNRAAYRALGVYNKFGNGIAANEILNAMNVISLDREAALEAWRAGQGAT